MMLPRRITDWAIVLIAAYCMVASWQEFGWWTLLLPVLALVIFEVIYVYIERRVGR